jgi:hypothetical protein
MKQMLYGITLLGLGLCLVNCQDGGSELPNELKGQAVLKGGNPAALLKVGLYSVNYIPADSGSTGLSWTTRTDASGRYAFKDIPPGRYNLVGIQDSLGFFRDSISISGDFFLGKDSLDKLGSLTGKVLLQPQHDPRNAVVQVMGTDIYVNVDANGRFTLSGLADGTYRLRVFVGLPNYVPLFKDIRVRAGMQDTLAPPLEPFFSGLPVVTGIQAVLDTARGIVKVTWRPVDYPSLLTYLVYRDPANAVELQGGPLNSTRILDSVYFDTLYRFDSSGRVLGGDRGQAWEYRVRVKANNSAIGDAFEAATLNAVSPSIFETRLQIERLGDTTYPAFVGDTVRFVARYSNSSYTHRNLAWLDESLDTLRRADLSAQSGSDTLVWIAPSQSDSTFIRVNVIDANGATWSRSAHIQVAASRIMGHMKASVTDINAYNWNGRIVYSGLDSTGSIVICLFDLETKKDSILNRRARVASSQEPSTTPQPHSTAFSGNKLYLIQAVHPDFPNHSLVSYDLATGLWAGESNVPGNVLSNGAVAIGEKLYVIVRNNNTTDSATMFELDLISRTWSPKNKRFFRAWVKLSNYDGAIYLNHSTSGPFLNMYEKYDPITNSWTPLNQLSSLQYYWGGTLVGLNRNLYNLGGFSIGTFYSKRVDRLDLNSNTWSAAPDYLIARGYPGVIAIGTRLYIIGGMVMEYAPNTTYSVPNSTIEEYIPE